ncbi:MAG: hypothetical protein ACRDR6_10800 [Pseudonocardiaceae bacterium]
MALLADIVTATAGDDARQAAWTPLTTALSGQLNLAFDHAAILRDACDKMRDAVTL